MAIVSAWTPGTSTIRTALLSPVLSSLGEHVPKVEAGGGFEGHTTGSVAHPGELLRSRPASS